MYDYVWETNHSERNKVVETTYINIHTHKCIYPLFILIQGRIYAYK